MSEREKHSCVVVISTESLECFFCFLRKPQIRNFMKILSGSLKHKFHI